jgi:hypothetical protein
MPDNDDVEEKTLAELLEEAAQESLPWDELQKRIRSVTEKPGEPEPPPIVRVIEALGNAAQDARYAARHGKPEDRQGFIDLADEIGKRKDEIAEDDSLIELADLTAADIEWIRLSGEAELADRVLVERQAAAERLAAIAEQQAEDDRRAKLDDEQRAAEDARLHEEALAQERENQIQALIDQTNQALVDKGDYSNPQPVTLMPADGGGAVRIEPQEAPAFRIYRPGYAKAAQAGVGLFRFQRLFEEHQQLPVGLRSSWWNSRTEIEKEVLESFGIRPSVSREEAIEEESEQA